MPDQQLSKNFWLSEFLVSQEAARRGLANVPQQVHIANLNLLCDNVLQPLRDKLGLPISISSGFRAPAVNAAVGGSSTSAHMSGCAADILVPGLSVAQLVNKIHGLKLPVDQVIDEYSSWVHVGIRPGGKNLRYEYISARYFNGRTVYKPIKF